MMDWSGTQLEVMLFLMVAILFLYSNNYFFHFILYRPLLLEYGLFDQVRVDHGT